MTLAGKNILITRPKEQGESLSAGLQAQGATCFVIPTIEIKPISSVISLEELSQQDKFIYISRNAVLYGPQLSQFKKPIYAIGQVTAQSLKDKGMVQAIIPRGFSSESLLEQADLRDVRNQNVLIVCGMGGRRLLEETLMQRGANCTRLEVYQRLYPQKNTQDLQEILARVVLDFVVVTSEQALENLVKMACDAGLVKNQQLIVIGPRLARSAKALGFNKPAMIVALADSASIMEVISNGEKSNG